MGHQPVPFLFIWLYLRKNGLVIFYILYKIINMIIYIYLRARWSTNNSNLDGKKTIFLKSLSYKFF